jgi:hypothetical protein
VAQSLVFAQQSVELADRSGDSFQLMSKKARLANALHQAGRLAEAETTFRETETMQKEDQPTYPLLYSGNGVWYCDLLLGQGKVREVRDRAAQTLEWAKLNQQGSLLDIALDNLTLGRASLRQGPSAGTAAEAADFLQRAVNGLRQAEQLQYLPRGLLARAELHRLSGDYRRAQSDLAEAQRIAERGEMGLSLCDCHLEWARLHLAMAGGTGSVSDLSLPEQPTGGEAGRLRSPYRTEDLLAQAREHWATAKAMIERIGYHRRDREVEEIARELGETA